MPEIVLALANAVAVAAFPVVLPALPLTLPVTLPVKGPAKAVAVAVPATCKAVLGLVVPIPTRLSLESTKRVLVSTVRSPVIVISVIPEVDISLLPISTSIPVPLGGAVEKVRVVPDTE